MKIGKEYSYYEHQNINNFKEMLENKKNTSPHKIAFSYRENGEIINKTYEDVFLEVQDLSAYFYKNYNNKHIALIGENSYNWLICFLSIILSGNVCVVIDKDSDKDKLNNLLKISETRIIFYSSKYCPFVKNLKFFKTMPIDDIDPYLNLGKKLINKYKIDNNKDAAIFFTSGTTGPNKAVVLSQKNMTFDIIGASSLYEPMPSGTVVSFLPFHHAFGLITSVLMAYNYEEKVFINTSLKNIMKDLKENKPDTLFAVPLFIETFYKQIWKNARNNHKEKILKGIIRLSNSLLKIGIDKRQKFFKQVLDEFGGNLAYIICGGAYLDVKYVKWFRSIGIEILNGYGITECAPVVSVNRNHYQKDGSVGVPCRDVEVKIIDGEICVKGQNVMKGYYKDKIATSKVIIDDYFHTGDLGYIDEDGFVFITGRKKNLIILSNGENISPEIIENALLKDEGVCEVIVYAKDNKIIAQIYPNEDYLGDQEYFDDLIYKYNQDKPKNAQIALVELRTTEFIKNNSKKILRDKVGKEDK